MQVHKEFYLQEPIRLCGLEFFIIAFLCSSCVIIEHPMFNIQFYLRNVLADTQRIIFFFTKTQKTQSFIT